MTDRRLRLNERPPDVVIADEPHAQRDAGHLGESHRGADARVGHRDDHVRISCPPTISPCFYGVDTPRRAELIAATHSLEEIRDYLEADSVQYLSLEGLLSSVQTERNSYCSSCYTGVYPVPFPRDEARYLQLALKLDRAEKPEAVAATES